MLFVPGADERKLERSRESAADTLLFDLEDAVVPEAKSRARQLVAELLRSGGLRCEAAVRVNAPGGPWFEDDLAAIVEAGGRTIMLPKSESAESLRRAAQLAAESAGKVGDEGEGRVRCLALVESAAGIANLNRLARADEVIDGLCFGHADFSLDMGLDAPDPAAGVIFHARCALAIAARAARLPAIDTVCLAVRDEDAFRADALLGSSLGYEGKLCIHPAQVAIANQVHTPTAERIEHAKRVVTAWREARSEGRGVFSLDGQMIDAPVALAQEQLLERARRAGALAEVE